MTLKEAVEAYASLKKISGLEMDFKSAYEVAKALGKLKEAAEFHGREEMRLAEKYGEKKDGRLRVEGGNIHFATAEDQRAFAQKRKELDELQTEDINIVIKPIRGDIAPDVLTGLLGIVSFAESVSIEEVNDASTDEIPG